ncbi:putative NTE family protein [Rhodocyclaceae bacterium]|nr:putative NTE family protein [Rhodocyclaceae bacterium]
MIQRFLPHLAITRVGSWDAAVRPACAPFALAASLLLASPPGVAADAPQAAAGGRPRIGLVLGGGGAKGGAHIGIIKVLEEMRVPVDCIAGTSMGAIVGAAYATGLSADALEKVVSEVNWKETLKSAPREDVPFHRKQLDFIFTMGFEFGVKDGGIVAPAGIVPTHQVEALFRRIVANARQTHDFRQLPIPFRAVATDLESGAMVVFDKGDLTVAMRASMAVPGAFSPVDYNGRLHVDGMLVRNLPVDVARESCADVVIAVPVGNPAATRAQLGSALAVAGQAMNIAIEANEKAQLATLTPKDVSIPVILQDISSGDFDKVPEAIPIGEAAARNARASLARYSLSPQAYAAWRADLRRIAEAPPKVIDEVRLAGLKAVDPEVMKRHLKTKPGDTYDPTQADADTQRLVERGDFSSVSYQVTTEDSRNVLTYNVTEKAQGPDYLLLDANLSTDFKGDTAWGLRADYERRWLNSLGGEFRASAQLGRPNILNISLYQPVEKSQTFFVSPTLYANQTLEYLYQGDREVEQLDIRRYGLRLEGGAALGTWGEVRLGLQRGGVTTKQKVGDPAFIAPGHSNTAGATLRFNYDQVDQRLFPTKGSSGSFTAYSSQTGLGADRNYRKIEGTWMTLFSRGRDVLGLGISGGTDLGSNAPYYDQFRLGGLFNMSGYRNSQLIGREYLFGVMQYRRRFADISRAFGTGIYAGASLEAGNVFKRLDNTPTKGALYAGSLFVGIDSKLGPVYLGYGLSEGGHSAWYLYIGSSLSTIR